MSKSLDLTDIAEAVRQFGRDAHADGQPIEAGGPIWGTRSRAIEHWREGWRETERMKTMRTPEEIIEQTNDLARQFYALMGYVVGGDHRFDGERINTHPQERMCWAMACAAQLALTDTDIGDVQSEIE